MWLLNTDTLELKEFFDNAIPPYAILSHKWSDEEVSWYDMRGNHATIETKTGYKKISDFCANAKRLGYSYAWMDSCCIDKRNSADLSEAINSMYRYYRDSGQCLVYLADVPPVDSDGLNSTGQRTSICNSLWFTRGWTLQELIAPKQRKFFASDWTVIELSIELIAQITGIEARVLHDHNLLSQFCIARRMSWASKRRTTRDEDMAYSLMGIFNVHMPVIYGEGLRSAFRRLQTEIIQTSSDQTIFVWRGAYESSGLLAHSPSDFANTPRLGLWKPVNLSPFSMTNVGLNIRMNIVEKEQEPTQARAQTRKTVLGALQCDALGGTVPKLLILYLESVPHASFFVNGKTCQAYRRVRCNEFQETRTGAFKGQTGPCHLKDVLILQDEHMEFVVRAIDEHQCRWEDYWNARRITAVDSDSQ
ncbi:hypothetical protein FVER53590_25847 [Fusarium verticillioides]|nr:hypothetical protein FVER53590_25847 [Fusarium verticillioides]